MLHDVIVTPGAARPSGACLLSWPWHVDVVLCYFRMNSMLRQSADILQKLSRVARSAWMRQQHNLHVVHIYIVSHGTLSAASGPTSDLYAPTGGVRPLVVVCRLFAVSLPSLVLRFRLGSRVSYIKDSYICEQNVHASEQQPSQANVGCLSKQPTGVLVRIYTRVPTNIAKTTW
jgi:hypothetical protein